MPRASPSWLALCALFISAMPNFVLLLVADPYITQAVYSCSLITYANATSFKENLNIVSSLLAENISSTGFATASNGNGIDGVYGLAQCRNDLSKKDCSTCYAAAQNHIVTYCPVHTGARMAFDGCFLRYENFSFFDQALDAGYSNVCISDASSSPKLFNEIVLRLLADLRSKALKNGGFATDDMSADGLPTAVYGLAMCRRTLNTSSCDLCLQHAARLIRGCLSLHLQDGRALEAGCYLRYSTIAFLPTNSSSSIPSKIVLILVGTLGGAALLAVLWLLFKSRHSFRNLDTGVAPGRSRRDEAVEYFIAEEVTSWDHPFSYGSIRAATNNFDPNIKIGGGGNGQVYKAKFNDGREVAVKKLNLRSTLDEFCTEVDLVGALRHHNLACLFAGFRRGEEKLLVYEFFPNLSLDKHLFANTAKPVSWRKRFEIILGTAHGLAYLNEECRPRILHRDIKAANILLDNEFEPKIADFGLAAHFPDDQTCHTTRACGTRGYIAPEYAIHGHLSDKVDVYSYGMLVLEIVSGRKHIDSTLPADMEFLLGWAWNLYKKSEAFSVVDRKIIEEEAEVNKEEILKVIQIAFLCTQRAPEMRPLMSKVVSLLTSNTEILPQPIRPASIDDNST
ncbi:hypothetical protein SUGI_0685100 [Cryptomeria japonica]|nr:hypothetical protein SUGI_0685100 [Cryptomeria japonica]